MADTFDAAMDTSGVRMRPVTSLPHRYIFWPSGLCSSPTWMWGRASSAAWGSPGSSPPLQQVQGHGAVQGPGVHVDEAQLLGRGLGQAALPGPGGAVDGNCEHTACSSLGTQCPTILSIFRVLGVNLWKSPGGKGACAALPGPGPSPPPQRGGGSAAPGGAAGAAAPAGRARGRPLPPVSLRRDPLPVFPVAKAICRLKPPV